MTANNVPFFLLSLSLQYTVNTLPAATAACCYYCLLLLLPAATTAYLLQRDLILISIVYRRMFAVSTRWRCSAMPVSEQKFYSLKC